MVFRESDVILLILFKLSLRVATLLGELCFILIQNVTGFDSELLNVFHEVAPPSLDNLTPAQREVFMKRM